jgi:hypothetical protein
MPTTPTLTINVNSAGVKFGEPSTFDLKITASDSSAYPLGRTDGWCVDLNTDITVTLNYTAQVYSSYELDLIRANPHFDGVGNGVLGAVLPSVPFDAAHPTEPYLANLDIVNWLMGNLTLDASTYVAHVKVGGAAAADFSQHFYTIPGLNGFYTYGDIQQALYQLLGDGWSNNADYLGPSDPSRVAEIVNEAIKHDGYVPHAGQALTVLLDVGANTQPLMIETTAAAIGDFVWHDLNANGIQDAGETGIDGVTVILGRDLNNDGDISDPGEVLATTTN